MEQKYSKTPEYKEHDYKEDVLNVLVCQIKVWKATAPDWFNTPDKCTVITEVDEIDINETCKELVNGAVVKLPKGAVINDTIEKKQVDDSVETGNKTDQPVETKLSESSRLGELLTIDSVVNKEGEHTLMIDDAKSDTGLAPESKNTMRIASQNDFQIGNRIEIFLGYVYQKQDEPDTITEKLQNVRDGEKIDELVLMFSGFITGCSVSTPLEIECENMASLLKKVSSRKGMYKGSYTVNDFLGSKGFNLLGSTGLKLSDKTQEANLKLSNFGISDNLSVYEMMRSWNKGNLYSMISRDGKEISVGYITGEDEWQEDKGRLDYSDEKSIQYIQSDWDVVNDNLESKKVDKEFLIVRAKAQVKDPKAKDSNTKKECSVLIGKVDGEWHIDKRDWRVHKKQKKKKTKKKQKGKSISPGSQPDTVSKYDLKKYHVVDFAPHHGIETIDDLIKEGKVYWDNWNSNGISGSLTLFGDLCIRPTQVIGYVDMWSPEKNGHYFVESVKTTFGVNGYRQTITIPRKISDFERVIKTI